MQTGNKFFLLLSLLMFSGCYEQEMKVKEWAKTNSHSYFRKVVELDAMARSSKAGVDLAETLKAIAPRLEPLSKRIVLGSPLASVTTNPTLEDFANQYRFYRDSFLDHFEDLVAVDSDLKRFETQLDGNSKHCDEYFKDHVLPPVDAGALAALSGQSGFSVYLSLSTNFGTGAGSTGVDFSQNGNLVEKIVDTLINKPIGDLFASDEAKNSLEETKKILTANMPDGDERREIAKKACRSVLDPLFTAGNEQKELIMRMREAVQESFSVLRSNSTATFVELQKALEIKKQQGLADSQKERIENEMFYRRSDILQAFCKQIDRSMLTLIYAIHTRDFPIIKRNLLEATKSYEEMGKFMIDIDLSIFTNKYRDFGIQIQKYEQKANVVLSGGTL
jgi:hypothetical protein